MAGKFDAWANTKIIYSLSRQASRLVSISTSGKVSVASGKIFRKFLSFHNFLLIRASRFLYAQQSNTNIIFVIFFPFFLSYLITYAATPSDNERGKKLLFKLDNVQLLEFLELDLLRSQDRCQPEQQQQQQSDAVKMLKDDEQLSHADIPKDE